MAGKQIGSIWGHGAYLAPDWSEDILHHMALVATGFHAGRSADEARRSAWTNSDALDVGERLGAAAITKVEAALVVLREAIDNL